MPAAPPPPPSGTASVRSLRRRTQGRSQGAGMEGSPGGGAPGSHDGVDAADARSKDANTPSRPGADVGDHALETSTRYAARRRAPEIVVDRLDVGKAQRRQAVNAWRIARSGFRDCAGPDAARTGARKGSPCARGHARRSCQSSWRASDAAARVRKAIGQVLPVQRTCDAPHIPRRIFPVDFLS